MIKNFDEMVRAAKANERGSRVALAGAADMHSLEAVMEACKEGIVTPVLIGKRAEVEESLRKLGHKPSDFELVDSGDENPGETAVKIIGDGNADFLMKGGIQTKDLMRPVLHDDRLSTGRAITGYAIAQIPNYHKFISNADGAMLPYPTLQQKKETIINTVEVLHKLGVEEPKVALLTPIETVSPKITETVDAAELVEMNKRGEITGCKLAGPMSYDLIMSKESAAIKKFDCPWCGDFDMILSPNLATGNTLTKVWAYSAGAVWAGLILGATVPIVLVSRGSSAEEKFYSLALAAVTSGRS